MQLSEITKNAEEAMSIKYNTLVYELQRQGKEVLVLSLGEAFFDIPLFSMEDLPHPSIYHYSHSRGIPELREKLAEYFLKKYDIPINYEKEILITAGSKAAIHFALMAVLNPADEVIIPEPAWVSYPEQVKLCHATPIQIPYYKSVFDLENYVTDKTKAIVICNPHNPTGHIYTKQEINHLLHLADKYNIWLLSDEAYSEFVDENVFLSPGKIDREKTHTIVFNSISKNYGISGWRLGYVIANESVIYNILKINQHIITCPATILEFYVEKYFYDILNITKPQITHLMQGRKNIAQYMDELGLKYLEGKGTFYFFVSISPSKLSSEEFCTKLLFNDFISVVPGLGYGKSCDKFIRISVGTEPLDKIKIALDKIKNMIDKTTNSKSFINNEVLVIAGGIWQKPLIQFLQKKGHIVTVVDPYLYSEGVQIADKHIKLDVRDSERILDAIGSNTYNFVTTDQSDISVNTVAILSEQLNLNSNPFQVTNLFVNKYEMRSLAKKLKIDIPEFRKIFTISELHEFINDIGLPIIIKPADSQSSRGVTKITEENIIYLEKYFIESLKYSLCGYIIAEKFINGFEITVEGFASNYKHRTLAMSKKKHFQTAIASSLEYPASINEDIFNKVEFFNDAFVENSGLRFGITHAEYMIDIENDKVNLVEIACRGGGTLISSNIINWVCGQNVYEMFYDNLIGNTTDVKNLELLRRNAILQFFNFKSGKVKDINGLEDAKKIDGVQEIKLSFKAGDILKPPEDDRSRHGFTIIYSNSKKELDASLQKVMETISVSYE
jgi:aminotransferase